MTCDGATSSDQARSLKTDLHLVWRWDQRRFTVEHGLRFSKQTLGCTTVRLRDPAAAVRWTWLLAIAFWQLWLARGARRRPLACGSSLTRSERLCRSAARLGELRHKTGHFDGGDSGLIALVAGLGA